MHERRVETPPRSPHRPRRESAGQTLPETRCSVCAKSSTNFYCITPAISGAPDNATAIGDCVSTMRLDRDHAALSPYGFVR